MINFPRIYRSIISKLEQNLPAHLTYHCAAHTKEVLRNAVFLAEKENVSGRDLCLLKIAALYHDTGFLLDRKEHEQKSCVLAMEDLKNELKEEDLEKICGMIMATRIPQEPKNKLERILADADLEYLGTDDFETISGNLYRELLHFNPSLSTEEWLDLQIKFISNHSYHTGFCKKQREPKKQENLEKLKRRTFTGPPEL